MRVKTDEKRQEIIAVASKVFGEQGYHKASMSAISTELGGSKATLYGYFKSKEELFAAVLTNTLEEPSQVVFDIIDSRHDDEIESVLLDFGLSYLKFVTKQEVSTLAKNAMNGEFSDKLGPEIYKNGPQRGWQHVEALLAAQMRSGVLACPSAKIASLHLKGLLESGIVEPIRYGREPYFSFEEAVENAVSVFLRAYRA
ncbi:TetR/AcrR family transcriptional regulator [uncultured Cohaesibacter sp.]|uniref:TetR/AcrR family transcriptional regulator n=1 Tax=uncultured Cohaesibacter sp. TaxID=1002546 RepID=UPI0029C8E75D|nr:TetR/AcrR family transcriptional regulator [uncultured Cohaesibacter sp.]